MPEQASDSEAIKQAAARSLGIPLAHITHCALLRRSIDARQKKVKFQLKLNIYINEPPPQASPTLFIRQLPPINNDRRACIVGAGPAGLFAALRLLRLGIKPILIERGKNVRDRRRDLALLNKAGIVNPESNYCFGEGGAGTYSDGKLYTRSDKRGNVKQILETLVEHGAAPDILIEAHPHIGTNKLPQIITHIRERILDAGGEVYFNTKLTDIGIKDNSIDNITLNGNQNLDIRQLILATGHSARDIFLLLHQKNILLEAKPFAMGVRIEHPQHIIDKMQYKCADSRPPLLPPAAYSWVQQANRRGVYSFCMCPGGIIAPCATAQNEIVTNGWSPSRRNNPYANSGIVVQIDLSDMAAYAQYGALAGMYLQAAVEHKAWLAGGQTQCAPAQRLPDFLNRKKSSDLPPCSYQPGIMSAQIDDILPKFIADALRLGLQAFGRKAPLYNSSEAILVAVESRTSSPVRIPRHKETLQHPQIEGLFPCGEGAGYAGGIVSAALDGQWCAEHCAATFAVK